jgi:predicted TIM-barrel fold metal-dependent hydrolase
MPDPYRIDVHHHVWPPIYFKVESERMAGTVIGWDRVSKWTASMSIEAMDRNDVAVTVNSVSTQHVHPDDPDGDAAFARECNEFNARLAADHKGRFGSFALLPLPHVDRCLREIEYAAGTLKADGFKLQTNYIDRWPGDPAFAPVFDELNRRKAAVFFHPHTPPVCMHLLPGVNEPLMEYPFDTTRAIASLLFSGTFARCPDIKYIFCHGGGAMPFLANRIGGLVKMRPELNAWLPNGIEHELKKLYFDVVSVTNRPAWAALDALVDDDHLLFGTDIPYMTFETGLKELAEMEPAAAPRRAIERDNAIRIMPSLKAKMPAGQVAGR